MLIAISECHQFRLILYAPKTTAAISLLYDFPEHSIIINADYDCLHDKRRMT